MKENICHRSKKAWPARVAAVLYGGPAVTEANEVFRQEPNSFIFRACSGAVTKNLWGVTPGGGAAPAGGQWDERIDGPPVEWFATPAQDLWLQAPPAGRPGFRPNNTIKLVTLSIGGNDSGFATIARHCLAGLVGYSRQKCLGVINEWETGTPGAYNTAPVGNREGLLSVGTKLPTVLSNIHDSAPMAKIRVVLYPRVLNTAVRPSINLWEPIIPHDTIVRIDNADRGLSGTGLTAAEAIDQFVVGLDLMVERTVLIWGGAHRGADVALVHAMSIFNGHKLGDANPWVNGLVFPFWPEESFHPNCPGHLSIARAVLLNLGINPGAPPSWTCP
jgi:hypothetical protein